MEAKGRPVQNDCSFSGVSPLMLPFPYPPTKVQEQNQFYANLLTMDYCGSVSELTAITQYIHGESCMCCEHCTQAKTLIGIAMAEMMHLQKLGELIQLLGGEVSFSVRQSNGKQMPWTPDYLTLSRDARRMLCADVEAERGAIAQYEAHIRKIKDECVDAVLRRIIRDEEYHIMLLQGLMAEL